MRPSSLFPRFLQIAFRGLGIFALVAGSVPVTANQPFSSKMDRGRSPAGVERFAVGAHHRNDSQIEDSRSTQFPAESVKPDGAEYMWCDSSR